MSDVNLAQQSDEKVLVVISVWKSPDGAMSGDKQHATYTPELTRVVELTAIGRNVDDCPMYSDHLGNRWCRTHHGDLGEKSYSLLGAGLDDQQIGTLIGNIDISAIDAVRRIYLCRDVTTERCRIQTTLTQMELIKAYYDGEFCTWEDIEGRLPTSCVITQDLIDATREQFLATYDTYKEILKNHLIEINRQSSEWQEKPVSSDLGPKACRVEYIYNNPEIGQGPHYLISPRVRHHHVHAPMREVNIVLSYFWDAIGGMPNYTKVMREDRQEIKFEYPGGKATARYVEHKNLNSEHIQQFVRVEASTVELPIHMWI